jgi:hypothetical protein
MYVLRCPEPPFAPTLKLTVPFPCPDGTPLKTIQLTFVEAVHAQDGGAVTAIEPDPPDDGNDLEEN